MFAERPVARRSVDEAIATRRRNVIWLLGHDVEGFTAGTATRAFTVTRPDVDWKL